MGKPFKQSAAYRYRNARIKAEWHDRPPRPVPPHDHVRLAYLKRGKPSWEMWLTMDEAIATAGVILEVLWWPVAQRRARKVRPCER